MLELLMQNWMAQGGGNASGTEMPSKSSEDFAHVMGQQVLSMPIQALLADAVQASSEKAVQSQPLSSLPQLQAESGQVPSQIVANQQTAIGLESKKATDERQHAPHAVLLQHEMAGVDGSAKVLTKFSGDFAAPALELSEHANLPSVELSHAVGDKIPTDTAGVNAPVGHLPSPRVVVSSQVDNLSPIESMARSPNAAAKAATIAENKLLNEQISELTVSSKPGLVDKEMALPGAAELMLSSSVLRIPAENKATPVQPVEVPVAMQASAAIDTLQGATDAAPEPLLNSAQPYRMETKPTLLNEQISEMDASPITSLTNTGMALPDGPELTLTSSVPQMPAENKPIPAQAAVAPITMQTSAAIDTLQDAMVVAPELLNKSSQLRRVENKPGFLNEQLSELAASSMPSLTDTGMVLPDGSELTLTSSVPQMPVENKPIPAQAAVAPIAMQTPTPIDTLQDAPITAPDPLLNNVQQQGEDNKPTLAMPASAPLARASTEHAASASTPLSHVVGEEPVAEPQLPTRADIDASASKAAQASHQALAVNTPTPLLSGVAELSSTLAVNSLESLDSMEAGLPQTSSNSLQTVAVKDIAAHAMAVIRQRGQDQGDARLALHPAELGSLDMTIEQDGKRLDMAVVVDNEQARAAVSEQLNQLRERLAESGLRLASLDISLRDSDERQNNDKQESASSHATEEAANNPTQRVVGLSENALDLYA